MGLTDGSSHWGSGQSPCKGSLDVVSQKMNLFCVLEHGFFSSGVAEKLVGGHDEKSMTSSFLYRIILYLAVRCRRFYLI